MRVVTTEPSSLTSALQSRIAKEIAAAGGWLPFDRFMELALYVPGLGYYANETAKFGAMPESGSDFVTAPEISPIFGQLVAAQLREALQKTDTREIWEFGAGTGALALQILDELAAQGALPERYTIVDLSGTLRARQKLALTKYEHLLRWVDALPETMEGVIIGNEVLDAMPVQLLQRTQGRWLERGVALKGDAFVWEDRPTELRPPVEIDGPHD
ncbi:MAG: SAM-dependent methyltransferase, partial [Comamonas sp.]|nr:SAM-dependent methyltransferase [Comamonas sp.]